MRSKNGATQRVLDHLGRWRPAFNPAVVLGVATQRNRTARGQRDLTQSRTSRPYKVLRRVVHDAAKRRRRHAQQRGGPRPVLSGPPSYGWTALRARTHGLVGPGWARTGPEPPSVAGPLPGTEVLILAKRTSTSPPHSGTSPITSTPSMRCLTTAIDDYLAVNENPAATHLPSCLSLFLTRIDGS